MIQSVNRRQSLEVMLTVVMALAFLLNINSVMNGVGQTASTLNIGTHAGNAIGALADAGDNIQSVTEGGVVQTLLGVVTGESNLSRSDPKPQAVRVEAVQEPIQQNAEGNIGEWIDQSGTWLLGLFTPSETSASGQLATSMGQALGTVPVPMQQAGEEFNHLSRPLMSNVHLEDKVVEQLRELHTTMATLICVWR